MKEKLTLTSLLILTLLTGYAIAAFTLDNQTVQAEGPTAKDSALNERIARLERILAIEQDAEEENDATVLVDERIIAALETLAENSQNLEEIVIRLEGIERELAWKRMDEQEAAN
jgi:hypothetical protein